MPWDLDVAAIVAETDELAASDAADAGNPDRRELLAALAAADARTRGRRGPGQPGSARRVPGWSDSSAGGFGAGQPLDIAPGGSALLGFAERVADDEERLGGATDDEIVGLICALDRCVRVAGGGWGSRMADLGTNFGGLVRPGCRGDRFGGPGGQRGGARPCGARAAAGRY